MANNLATAINQFSLNLYRSIGSDASQDQNVFMGPFTVAAALAMVNIGARGTTRDEIVSGLRLKDQFGSNIDQINTAFKELLSSLDVHTESNSIEMNSRPGGATSDFGQSPLAQLNIADRVFLQSGTSVKQPFSDALKTYYNSTFGSVDFKSPEAKHMINGWVSNVTNDKINDLFRELDPSTKMVLVSAMYFKAAWKEKFSSQNTEDKAFRLPGGQSIQAKLMKSQDTYAFADFSDLKASAVRVPYVGEYDFIIILPNGENGLPEVENLISSEVFQMSSYKSADVDLSFPKFDEDASYDLVPPLKSLGINAGFSDSAEFTGISEGNEFRLDQVVHKAHISVNENGTEAAAATGVTAVFLSAMLPMGPKKVFRADHPFMFAIQHVPTETVLFIGKMNKPQSKK